MLKSVVRKNMVVLLAFVLVLSLLPANALLAQETSNEVERGVYEECDREDMQAIRPANATLLSIPSAPRGVTVKVDSSSPTGFTAIFVYHNIDAYRVRLGGNMTGLRDIYTSDTTVTPISEFRPGLFPVSRTVPGGFFPGPFRYDMVDIGDGYWELSIPVVGGTMTYHYYVNYAATGSGVVRSDPYNPAAVGRPIGWWSPGNPPTNRQPDGNPFESYFFVPFDPDKQHPLNNRDIERPRDDQVGEIRVGTYKGYGGDYLWYSVYLPYNFDVNRARPYPVLLAFHGSGDNELYWMTRLSGARILDNLIAYGYLEPVVMVSIESTVGGAFAHINTIDNIMYYLLPYIAETYNVSSRPDQRAALGLSEGTVTMADLLFQQTEQFGYLGFFSGSGAPPPFVNIADYVNALDQDLTLPTIVTGYGSFMGMAMLPMLPGLVWYNALPNALYAAGIAHSLYTVTGLHDTHTWTQMFTIFARDYLWSAPPVIPIYRYFTVSFDMGDGRPIDCIVVRSGTPVRDILPCDEAYKTGYELAGWMFASGTPVDVDRVQNINWYNALVAIWIPKYVPAPTVYWTISFVTGLGTPIECIMVPHGTPARYFVPYLETEKHGHELEGWMFYPSMIFFSPEAVQNIGWHNTLVAIWVEVFTPTTTE